MILENYLNESIKRIKVPKYYSGESGMNNILSENTEFWNRLEEKILYNEAMMMVCKYNSDYETYKLLEADNNNANSSILDGLKAMWEKIKNWFVNLFKEIYAAVADITKVIDKYKDDIDKKDSSNFVYQGYRWNTVDPYKYSGKLISFMGRATQLTLGRDIPDNIEGIKLDTPLKSENLYNFLIHSDATKEAPLSEVESTLTEAYRQNETPEDIKNFNACNRDDMVRYLKDFKDNKLMKDIEGKTNKAFSELMEFVKKFMDQNNIKESAELISEKSDDQNKNNGSQNNDQNKNNQNQNNNKNNSNQNKNDNDNRSEKQKDYDNFSSHVDKNKDPKNFRAIINLCKVAMSAFNSFNSIVIKLEKEKYDDYRKAIIQFIKYKP